MHFFIPREREPFEGPSGESTLLSSSLPEKFGQEGRSALGFLDVTAG